MLKFVFLTLILKDHNNNTEVESVLGNVVIGAARSTIHTNQPQQQQP